MILKYNKTTKKCQGDEYSLTNDRQIVLSQPNSPKCPVASFKFYLTKLTEIEPLFQQGNPKFKRATDRWYNRSPCGIFTIGSFLKEISENAGLLYICHALNVMCAQQQPHADFSVTPNMMHMGTNRKAQQFCGSGTNRE